ncbi:hypothetical protein NQ317_009899 [Molorchus minor]|uniref:Uncharacterized protein n=1 Tax=Molorchus minor TaxID=1323400 RepID=A0ABQ9IUE6_9CUCU|nr:hypothetical protein NQ317_009899 [Molorchus minor]
MNSAKTSNRLILTSGACGSSLCAEYWDILYKLDPTHYYTAPGLSWDAIAMLKLARIELELVTDIDMIRFLKKGIRGGIKPASYIMYLDVPNPYGHSMGQALPTDEFRWLSTDEIANL